MIPVRVLLADDHALVRAGIRALLEVWKGSPSWPKRATAARSGACAQASPGLSCCSTFPCLDSGTRSERSLKQELQEVRVVMLSMHANEEYVLQALRSGASGYMLKDSATAELELACKP